MSDTYTAGLSSAELASTQVDTGSQETNLAEVSERQGNQIRQETAAYLASKHSGSEQATQFGGTDNLDMEVELQQVQQRLHREGPGMNPLERMQLEQMATSLAAKLVGESVPTQQEFNARWDQDESPADELRSQYGEQAVNETLQWAGSTLSEEVSVELNEMMAKNDANTQVTFEGLRRLQQNPELVNRGDIGKFDIAVANELAEAYGESGEQLAAINAALSAGKCSRAQAAKMVMGNPQLAQTAMSAAQAGLINLAL